MVTKNLTVSPLLGGDGEDADIFPLLRPVPKSVPLGQRIDGSSVAELAASKALKHPKTREPVCWSKHDMPIVNYTGTCSGWYAFNTHLYEVRAFTTPRIMKIQIACLAHHIGRARSQCASGHFALHGKSIPKSRSCLPQQVIGNAVHLSNSSCDCSLQEVCLTSIWLSHNRDRPGWNVVRLHVGRSYQACGDFEQAVKAVGVGSL